MLDVPNNNLALLFWKFGTLIIRQQGHVARHVASEPLFSLLRPTTTKTTPLSTSSIDRSIFLWPVANNSKRSLNRRSLAKMNAHSLIASASINIGLAFLVLSLFSILKKQPTNAYIYYLVLSPKIDVSMSIKESAYDASSHPFRGSLMRFVFPMMRFWTLVASMRSSSSASSNLGSFVLLGFQCMILFYRFLTSILIVDAGLSSLWYALWLECVCWLLLISTTRMWYLVDHIRWTHSPYLM